MKHLIIYLSLAICLSGCASISDVDALIPQNLTPISENSKLHKAVSVTETSRDYPSAFSKQISDKSLNAALRQALIEKDMFSEMEQSYSVQANLIHLDQPMIGLDMTVTSKVQYLVKDKTGRIILDRTIASPYTAKMNDSFVGATRLKKANEGSIRKNISDFIQLFSNWIQDQI